MQRKGMIAYHTSPSQEISHWNIGGNFLDQYCNPRFTKKLHIFTRTRSRYCLILKYFSGSQFIDTDPAAHNQKHAKEQITSSLSSCSFTIRFLILYEDSTTADFYQLIREMLRRVIFRQKEWSSHGRRNSCWNTLSLVVKGRTIK